MYRAVFGMIAVGGGGPIVFFDAECGLCDRLVRRLWRADRRGELCFAPLAGETAKALLPPLPEDRGDWFLVYLDERGVHERSRAVLEIARRLGGWWWWLGCARFVPRVLRDWVYRWVARRRLRLFGRADACPWPGEEERFLA